MNLLRPALLTILLTALPTTDALAACGKKATQGFPITNHTCLRLINDSPSVFSTQDLEDAKNQWTGCPGTGVLIPDIQVGGSGCKRVHIRHVPGRNPIPGGSCEKVDVAIAGTTLLNASVTVYTKQNSGTSCLPLKADIGHAIGHILGLDDKTTGACTGTIMGKRPAGTTRQPAKAGDECAVADEQNETYTEGNGGGGGGGCGFLLGEPGPTERITLPLEGSTERLAETGAFRLERIETVEGIGYLLDEWAVVERPSSGLPVGKALNVRASSARFAVAVQRRAIADVAPKAGAASVALLIESPVHPHNARHVPQPLVDWRDRPIGYLGPKTWAAVRVDVGEDRRIRGVDLLSSSSTFPADIDLERHVAEGLGLTFLSKRQHRVFAYLVIDASDGQLSLRDAVVTLPKCCCILFECVPRLCDVCIR